MQVFVFENDQGEIKEACMNRYDFELNVPVENTVWASSPNNVPQEWTCCEPARLTNDAYAYIFANAQNNLRDQLMVLELAVFLDGGKIKYKAGDDDNVILQISWPE